MIAVGHYHVPALLQLNADHRTFTTYDVWNLPAQPFRSLSTMPLIVNPGSTTFPREGVANPSASFVLLDVEDNGETVTVQFRRLAWDWRDTLTYLDDGYPAANRLRRQLQYSPLPIFDT
jgi:hypothetical protein